MNPVLLMRLFAGLLIAVAVLMMRRSVALRRARERPESEDAAVPADTATATTPTGPHRRWWRAALSVVLASVIGLLTGMFGVGGGFIVVPALLLVMGVSMRLAVGTSLLVIIVNSATSLLARIGDGLTIDWVVLGVYAVASMLGGLLGARFSSRARPDVLALLFALLLTGIAVATGIQVAPNLRG